MPENEKISQPAHRLGIKGHFALSSLLQDNAQKLGLKIEYLGENRYAVHSRESYFNISQFISSEISANDNIFDLKNLQKFLAFLHQPIRNSLDEKIARPLERQNIHKILRFAGGFSPVIPKENYAHLEIDIDDEHFQTEADMRDTEKWDSESEIGNPKNMFSSIPLSALQPEHGFYFNFSGIVPGAALSGQARTVLAENIWSMVNGATCDRYQDMQEDVFLSAHELQLFCAQAEANHGELASLIHEARLEERVSQHASNVQARMKILDGEAIFKNCSMPSTPAARLQNLALATTALTPILNNLKGAWSRYNFSQRDNSPFGQALEEFSIFQQTIEMVGSNHKISDALVEAIGQEFFEPLAFAHTLAGKLEKAFKQDATPGSETKSAYFNKLAATIYQGSYAGIALDVQHMNMAYQNILTVFEKSAKLKGFEASEIVGLISASALRFGQDMTSFIREHPKKSIVTLCVLFGALHYLNAQSAQPATVAGNLVYALDSGDMTLINVPMSSLSAENLAKQSYHWDVGLLGPYKHFKALYNAVVTESAHGIIEGTRALVQFAFQKIGLSIDADPHFSKTANNTIDYLAENTTRFQIFQDLTHSTFWGLTFANGYRYGLKNWKKIFDLCAPIVDMAHRCKHGIQDKIGPDQTLSVRLMNLVGQATIDDERPLKILAEAAECRARIETLLPSEFREFDFNVRNGGLSSSFHMNADNWLPVLRALDQFDFLLSQCAGNFQTCQMWAEDIYTKLSNVRHALDDFAADGNVEVLKNILAFNLDDLMAAEMRVRGFSPLYSILSEKSTHGDVALSQRGARNFHRLHLQDRINAHHAALGSEEDQAILSKLEHEASIGGLYIWRGMVAGAQMLRDAPEKIPPALKWSFILTAGVTVGASIAFDMAGKGTDLSTDIARASGHVFGGSLYTVCFVIYQWGQDIVQNHLGGGLLSMGAGSILGAAHSNLLRPAAHWLKERLQINTNPHYEGFEINAD